jgi:hypothetical protein
MTFHYRSPAAETYGTSDGQVLGRRFVAFDRRRRQRTAVIMLRFETVPSSRQSLVNRPLPRARSLCTIVKPLL